MTAYGSLLLAHAGLDGNSISAVETGMHWVHGVAALGWVMAVAIVGVAAMPTARSHLTVEGRNRLDARLEAVILAGGACTATLIVTGFYNLKKSTPYPAPVLTAPLSRVRELPEATPYFGVLAVKLAVYVGMLGAAAVLIRRARRLAGTSPREGAWIGGSAASAAMREDGATSSVGGGSLLVAPAAGGPRRPGLVPVVFGAGAAIVLLCVNLLGSLHLQIERLPDRAAVSAEDDHAGGVAPLFSNVAIALAGKQAWDVTLTLSDLHTQDPISSAEVTVTGRGPAGATVGPEEFAGIGKGRYRGRVSGPPGEWELQAVAGGASGRDLPPTQQTFALRLLEPTPRPVPGS